MFWIPGFACSDGDSLCATAADDLRVSIASSSKNEEYKARFGRRELHVLGDFRLLILPKQPRRGRNDSANTYHMTVARTRTFPNPLTPFAIGPGCFQHLSPIELSPTAPVSIRLAKSVLFIIYLLQNTYKVTRYKATTSTNLIDASQNSISP